MSSEECDTLHVLGLSPQEAVLWILCYGYCWWEMGCSIIATKTVHILDGKLLAHVNLSADRRTRRISASILCTLYDPNPEGLIKAKSDLLAGVGYNNWSCQKVNDCHVLTQARTDPHNWEYNYDAQKDQCEQKMAPCRPSPLPVHSFTL